LAFPQAGCNACRVRAFVKLSDLRDTVPAMRIGYGRVSTRDQNPNSQQDALTAAGCEQIFTDKASGKLARRPELDKALLVACRRGDQLVITKLDRLGRSLEHLIDLSAELQKRGVDLVAVCQNDAAVLELGDDTLKAIAHELVAVVRRNATIDWDKKEQVRASLRRHIRRLLAKHKYPPDKQESAVSLVMQQAELFAAELVA
jgi:DNA invertase Pin-like site-specific DNA recombinase